ncbi:MAG: phage tail tape measure protein, partial [Novosphingobium sp.]|nr:phage tail tape measure protein [Novosphingobium sp.]
MMLAMTKGEAATKSQSKAFAALGLDATKVANAMQEDAGGAITDILERLKKLPEAQQAATLTQLFGSESVAAIAPMLTNLDRLKQNLALVGDKTAYAGSMQKEYLTRIATTEGAVGLATNALKAINITLGTELLPTITAGAQKVVAIANAVRGWTKEHPGLAKGLLMTWTAASSLVLGLGGLKFGLGLVLGPFGTLFRVVKTNGPMLMRLFTGIRTAALFMGSGLLRAGAMMLANPIVLVIAAIVAAVAFAGYMIYRHWDKISAALKAGVAWVKGAIGGLPDWLKNLGAMMMNGLLLALNPVLLAKRLVEIAKAGITAFKNYFGIKSPSRLMMGMGGYITGGLAVGIDRGKGAAIGAAKAMATGVAGASLASAGMAPAATGGGRAGVIQQFGPVTIMITAAPGQSPQDIAEAVSAALGQQADIKRASHRSAFTDT